MVFGGPLLETRVLGQRPRAQSASNADVDYAPFARCILWICSEAYTAVVFGNSHT
jgi:hypothetical protein